MLFVTLAPEVARR